MADIDIDDATGGGLRSGADMQVHEWVAYRVKLRRMLVGMSRGQFAKAMGVQPNQTLKWDKGLDKMSPQRIWDAARILNVSPGWFFEGKDGEDYAALGVGNADMAVVLSPWALNLARDLAHLPDWQREFVEACVTRFKKANEMEKDDA